MSGAGECCNGIGPTATSTTTFAPSLAAPLSKGSAASPGVNAPGRRQEDDVNLVAMAFDAYNQAEDQVTHSLRKAQGDGIPLTFGMLGQPQGMRFKTPADQAETLRSAHRGRPGLIFSQADSRAKTSPSPESDEDSLASGQDSSLSSPGSQMSFDQVGSSLRTSLGSSPLPTDETWESFSQRWPKSGTASAGEWSTLHTSEFPSDAVECSLSDVLETTVSERYALSARAAKGILRRANARGKTLPPELSQALTSLARSRADTEKA